MKAILGMFMTLATVLPALSQNLTENKIHKLQVQAVLQTTSYTYLYVKEDSALNWIAIPKMEASEGEVYYSSGGMEMRNFFSRELDRTFPLVYFMDFISKKPEGAIKREVPASETQQLTMPEHGAKPKIPKARVYVEPAPAGIRIAELFKNKDKYAGKVVKIRGQVVKFNDHIMGRNWVHLQDGTSFDDNYDLTVTLLKTVKVGDQVTLKGVISLDKDFGSGYSFIVLMEDADVID
jgi:hypothetical protein